MLKRTLDIIHSLLGLLILAVPMVLIALLIKLTSSGPVLFRQRRLGLNGKPFTIVKFRTMSEMRDSATALLPDAQRITRLGRFLRRSSLDELPELFNVLRGEMSMVGPRPLLLQYWERYSAQQRRRNLVKPGLTGWVQVNGRNALTWEQKFALDIWYVDHQSLWLDLKIILLTIWKVLRQDGISHANHATMEEFWG
jgi:lipopolysaccharide/colanic/teichoic acid biosynthesis glycosyltransferase